MMNHIQISNKADCTGCRACEQLCPQGCISILADDEGFLSPAVNEDQCIECGVCLRQCPQRQEFRLWQPLSEPVVYAAKLKDRETLHKSSSGGAFSALAQYVLARGGVVFGAVFDEHLVAKHVYSETWEGIAPMRGSKYVQSDTGNTFGQAKHFLDQGRWVLYTGCPCQIAGLHSFLGKQYDTLLAVDLICHGVPSPLLFGKYINWLGTKHKGKLTAYDFRNKDVNGWSVSVKYEGNSNSRPFTRYINQVNWDPYYRGFVERKTLRMCCYECHYACERRVGDITIADYWGLDKAHPDFMDSEGVSLLFTNNLHGARCFDNVRAHLEVHLSDFEKATVMQTNLSMPSGQPSIRKGIYENIRSLSFDKYASRYLSPKGIAFIKLCIPRPIKRVIKSLLGRT